jgi:hypothetical protein
MFRSLRVKFVLYFVGFTTATVVLLAKSLFDHEHEVLLSELRKRLAVESGNLAIQSREAMETNDDLSILATLRGRASGEPGIRRRPASGRQLFAQATSFVGRQLSAAAGAAPWGALLPRLRYEGAWWRWVSAGATESFGTDVPGDLPEPLPLTQKGPTPPT